MKRRTQKNNYVSTVATKNGMEFEIRLFENASDNSKVVAYGSITFAKVFTVRISVFVGKNGYFVRYPCVKSGDDWYDQAFPIDKNFRDYIEKAVTGLVEEL